MQEFIAKRCCLHLQVAEKVRLVAHAAKSGHLVSAEVKDPGGCAADPEFDQRNESGLFCNILFAGMVRNYAGDSAQEWRKGAGTIYGHGLDSLDRPTEGWDFWNELAPRQTAVRPSCLLLDSSIRCLALKPDHTSPVKS